MNKNAYDIAFKNHREQLLEDILFHSAIYGLMNYGCITEKDYINTIAQVCEIATMYKNELAELQEKQNGDYSVADTYEI